MGIVKGSLFQQASVSMERQGHSIGSTALTVHVSSSVDDFSFSSVTNSDYYR